METVVCGIDPGLKTTGYAVLRFSPEGPSIVDAGICRFDETLPLATRLAHIERDVGSILDEHRPHVLAVEQLYSHYKHPRTSILMAHARGVILLTAAARGIEVRDYAATRVKRHLTGNGRATKGHVQRTVAVTMGLSAPPEPSDLADAIAIALCCGADLETVACGAKVPLR